MTLEKLLKESADELRATTVASVPSPPSRSRWVPVVAGTVVLLTLLAVAAFVGTRPIAVEQAAGETSIAGSSTPPVLEAEFQYFDGSVGTIADYRGTPIVVNFWASWCPYCRAEMKDALQPAHIEREGSVAFLGLNLQDSRAAADRLVGSTGADYDLAVDAAGDLYTELGGITMPFTVFISADGEIVRRVQGAIIKADLDAYLDELVASP